MNLNIYKIEKQNAIELINSKHAFTQLNPDDVFIFGGRLSSQSLDSHKSRMTSKTIRNFADNANRGFPLIVMHNKQPLPIGRVFMGEISGEENNLSLDILAYIPRGLTVAEGVNTDNYIRGVETSTFNQMSVGFDFDETKDALCSVCNQPIVDCKHIPGKRYNGNRAFYWVDNGTAQEASLVSVGSNPDTKVIKIIRGKEEMEFDLVRARLTTINPDFATRIDEVKEDDEKVVTEILEILEDTERLLKTTEKTIETLKPKAELADVYMTSLIEDAVKARVRANGQGTFDDEKYRGVLTKVYDIDYIKSEIERWDETAKKELLENERTIPKDEKTRKQNPATRLSFKN